MWGGRLPMGLVRPSRLRTECSPHEFSQVWPRPLPRGWARPSPPRLGAGWPQLPPIRWFRRALAGKSVREGASACRWEGWPRGPAGRPGSRGCSRSEALSVGALPATLASSAGAGGPSGARVGERRGLIQQREPARGAGLPAGADRQRREWASDTRCRVARAVQQCGLASGAASPAAQVSSNASRQGRSLSGDANHRAARVDLAAPAAQRRGWLSSAGLSSSASQRGRTLSGGVSRRGAQLDLAARVGERRVW